MRSVAPSSFHRVTSQLTTAPITTSTATAQSYRCEPSRPNWPDADIATMASTPTAARPERTSGDSGCSRCHLARLGRHRPAAFASPRAASRSRSRAASSRSRPGIRASLAAAAVCSFTVASRNARSTGPAVTSTNCIRP